MKKLDTMRISTGDRFKNQKDEIMRYDCGELVNQKTGVIYPVSFDTKEPTVADLRLSALKWGVELQ